jgi:hypothetical protein
MHFTCIKWLWLWNKAGCKLGHDITLINMSRMSCYWQGVAYRDHLTASGYIIAH